MSLFDFTPEDVFGDDVDLAAVAWEVLKENGIEEDIIDMTISREPNNQEKQIKTNSKFIYQNISIMKM